MADYILLYQGGSKPASQEEGAKQMANWQAWAEGLGEAIINPGTPTGKPKIVSSKGVSDDTSSNAMTGYTIVRANSMEDALEMAESCPFIEMDNASLAVAELMSMS